MFLDSYRFLQEKLYNIAKSLDSKDLEILGKHFDINITLLETLNETELPPIEAFYSTLYIIYTGGECCGKAIGEVNPSTLGKTTSLK